MLKALEKHCEPTLASKLSCCVDLYARKTVTIAIGKTEIVPLGVTIDIEKARENFVEDLKSNRYNMHCYNEEYIEEQWQKFLLSHGLVLKPRSSLPLKKRLIIANGSGEIEFDYVPKCKLGNTNNGACKTFNSKKETRSELTKCKECKNFEQSEIGIILHNPMDLDFVESIACQEVLVSLDGRDRKMPKTEKANITINIGEKIAQIKIAEHKTRLFGIKTDKERVGGFGGSGGYKNEKKAN